MLLTKVALGFLAITIKMLNLDKESRQSRLSTDEHLTDPHKGNPSPSLKGILHVISYVR